MSFFELTDGGEADGLIGFKSFRDRLNKVIYLDQFNAIIAILEEHQSVGDHKAKVPMAANTKIYLTGDSEGANPESTLDATPTPADHILHYHEMIGKILYYANRTRPDIAYTELDCWHVDRLFAYFKETSNHRLKSTGTLT